MSRCFPILAQPGMSTGTASFVREDESVYLITAAHCLFEQNIEYEDVDGHHQETRGEDYEQVSIIEPDNPEEFRRDGDIDGITAHQIDINSENTFRDERWDIALIQLQDYSPETDGFYVFDSVREGELGDSVTLEGFPQTTDGATTHSVVSGQLESPLINIDFGDSNKYIGGLEHLPSNGASGGPVYNKENLCGVYSTNYRNTATNRLTGQTVNIQYAIFVDIGVIDSLLDS